MCAELWSLPPTSFNRMQNPCPPFTKSHVDVHSNFHVLPAGRPVMSTSSPGWAVHAPQVTVVEGDDASFKPMAAESPVGFHAEAAESYTSASPSEAAVPTRVDAHSAHSKIRTHSAVSCVRMVNAFPMNGVVSARFLPEELPEP